MVAIDCLLTCVHWFLHRCEALWQRVLNVSQLHIHNNVGPLKEAGRIFKVMYANSTFKKDREQDKEKVSHFLVGWGKKM